VEFTFCEGDHPDTNAAKEACWESQPKKRRNLSTLVTTDHNGGYCSRDCRAEISGLMNIRDESTRNFLFFFFFFFFYLEATKTAN